MMDPVAYLECAKGGGPGGLGDGSPPEAEAFLLINA